MQIKDRIKELRRVPAKDIQPNPKNWRTHPGAQVEALRSSLEALGVIDALICRELEDGSLMLIDGHLRRDEMAGQEVDVVVLDVDAQGEAELLMLLDPVGSLAQESETKRAEILAEIDTAPWPDALVSLVGAAGLAPPRRPRRLAAVQFLQHCGA